MAVGGWIAGAAACSGPIPVEDDDDTSGEGGQGGTTTSVSTTSPTTTTTGGGGAGPMCETTTLSFNEPACASCVEAQCCMPLQACDSSMACLDYLGCVQACGDQACADGCATTYPQGMVELDALDDCLASDCATPCGAEEDFPICDSGLSVPEEACATCLGTTCCEDVKTCEEDATCLACVTGTASECDAGTLDDAVRDCWDVDCMNDCGMAGF